MNLEKLSSKDKTGSRCTRVIQPLSIKNSSGAVLDINRLYILHNVQTFSVKVVKPNQTGAPSAPLPASSARRRPQPSAFWTLRPHRRLYVSCETKRWLQTLIEAQKGQTKSGKKK